MTTSRALMAEVLGTFYLWFIGIGVILSTTPAVGGRGLVAVALAHGLALTIAVMNFGGISGAHFKPAVTCGMLITGRIRPALAVLYVVAQLLGATIAAIICGEVFPAEAVHAARLGIPLPAAWAPPATVLIVEFILTFLLIVAIFGKAVDGRGKTVTIGAFGIGLTVAFDILAGGPVTGASMNPARSFGPALAYWHNWHWAYWIAPILGGSAAALLYHHFLLEAPPEPPVQEEWIAAGGRR